MLMSPGEARALWGPHPHRKSRERVSRARLCQGRPQSNPAWPEQVLGSSRGPPDAAWYPRGVHSPAPPLCPSLHCTARGCRRLGADLSARCRQESPVVRLLPPGEPRQRVTPRRWGQVLVLLPPDFLWCPRAVVIATILRCWARPFHTQMPRTPAALPPSRRSVCTRAGSPAQGGGRPRALMLVNSWSREGEGG